MTAAAGGEEVLRQTVQAFLEAFVAGDIPKTYSFSAEDWQARCPIEDFSVIVNYARASLSLFTDLTAARVVIDEIRVEGDRGYHKGHLETDKGSVDFGEQQDKRYPSYWIWRDGKWWATDDNPTPCKIQ